jgi:hypothetical protein
MTIPTQQRMRELQTSGAAPELIRLQEIILKAVGILRTSKVKTLDDLQCEADVRQRIDNIYVISKIAPSDSELRENLKIAKEALQGAAEVVPPCFENIHGHIGDALNWIKFYADRRKASEDSGPKKTKEQVPLNTRAKYVAAENAHYLIRHWTTEMPTQSAQGHYFNLARRLYEAGTGNNADDPGQSIDAQCRKYAKEWNARNKAARA